MSTKPRLQALRPSAAGRWSLCTRSPWLEVDYPDHESEHAAAGTAAHAKAEQWLRTGARPAFDEPVFKKDKSLVECVEDYVGYVRGLETQTSNLFVEVRLHATGIDERLPPGTSDAVLVDGKRLVVADLKTGRGVVVSAEDSVQGAEYALMAIDLFEEVLGYGPFEEVEVHIVQTRAGRDPDVWAYDRATLDAVREQLRGAVEEVYAGGQLRPGEKACRFCKAAGDCRAYAEYALAKVIDHFDDIEHALDQVDDLTPHSDVLGADQVAAVLDKLGAVEDWIASFRKGAQARALRGDVIPGRKLVLGTKHRKWDDDELTLAAMLKAGVKIGDCTKQVLISPAQAAKVLGKDHAILEAHAVTPLGDPVLVPESDKRPPWVPTPGVEFDVLD